MILRSCSNEVSRDDILGKDCECVVVHNMLHSMYTMKCNQPYIIMKDNETLLAA